MNSRPPDLPPEPKSRANWPTVSGYLLVIAVLLGSGALCFRLFWRHHMPPIPVAKKIPTVTAQIGAVTETIHASGKLTLFRYVDVGTQNPGQIKDVHVAVGDNVKAGKLLLEMTPADENARSESNRAQLARLQAELADQSAQLEFTQLQYQRQIKLKADDATRDENVESSRMNMLSSAAKADAIHAQIQQIEASLKQDDARLQKNKVLAPMTGTVVALSAHAGQMLSANQSTLLRIADLDKMTVQARVAENDVTRLRNGMTASFTTPGIPGKRWYGKLKQIMPLPIDDNAQLGKQSFYMALFDVANPDRQLMSGMNADVEFIEEQAENVIAIPARLVRQRDASGALSNTQTIFVVTPDGKSTERRITIGLRNEKAVQVVSGLQAGEQVALDATSGNAKGPDVKNDAPPR